MDQTNPPSPPPSLFESSSTPINTWLKYEGQPAPSPTSLSFYRGQSPDESPYLDPVMAHPRPSHGPSVPYPDLSPGDVTTAYEMISVPSNTAQPYNMTPEASPPTMSHHLSDVVSLSGTANPRATRDMKTLAVKSGRIEKGSPKKKSSVLSSPPTTRKEKAAAAAAAAAAAGEDALISQPLSILTKDWDIPIIDIDAYVRRSVQERHEEVERGKVPGKVKRAMNAFMLYRKAYQDRAKRYAQQSNHQIVSKVCGMSWSMEPRSVRSQFNEWATIERDNHRIAHPEYKFTPSKPRKRAGENFDEFSDLEDPDWHGAKRRSKSRTPMHDLESEYRPPRGVYAHPYATGIPEMQSYQPPQQHRPVLQLSNMSRHSYGPDSFAAPGMHYQHGPPPTGYEYSTPSQQSMGLATAPQSMGQSNYGMGDQYTQQAMPQQQMGGLGQQIDPSLMNRDNMPQYDMSGPLLTTASLSDSQWQPNSMGTESGDTAGLFSGPYFAEMDETYLQDTQLQYLRGGDESWKIGPINETEEWQPE